MGWDATEIKTFDGRTIRVLMTCRHDEAIPVESGGAVVAHLCPDCDQQFPAKWGAA